MTTPRRHKATAKRQTPKKKRRVRPRGTMVMLLHPPRLTRPRRVRPAEREIVGLRCRVMGVHPDAEAIVLCDFYGKQVLVPITSAAKDGRFARDLVGLVDRDVWLSLRLP